MKVATMEQFVEANDRGPVALTRQRQVKSKIVSLRTEDTDRALPVSLLRTREAVMSTMRPILRSHGMTEQQLRVLRALSLSEPKTKTALAAEAVLLMPSLLRILQDLEKMKLVRLVRTSESTRLSQVVLTEKGSKISERMTRDVKVQSKIIRKIVGSEEYDRLLDLLQYVQDRLKIAAF